MEKKKIVTEIANDLYHTMAEMAKQQEQSISCLLSNIIEEHLANQSKLKKYEEELAALKQKEIHAFAIGDAIYDGIYVINNKGIIIAVNKVYTEMVGISQEELIGKPARVLVEKKIFEKETGLQALKSKEKISAMCTIIRNNKQVLKTSNPIKNEQGEVIEVLTVIRDITDLIKLKEELENSERANKQYLDELNYFRRQEMSKMGLIGDSPNMILLKDLILNVAQSDASVLISGETGVGKEVVAREIVKYSSRKNGPYIKVNCAAIPDNLLESELFGYEKGAFTGAQNKNKLGFFEMANNGTILLDEIGDMPLKLQAKLLRVLQEREFTRVGGNEMIQVDVRVIASTNVDLEKKIKEGTFREDLYYRLNVIPVKIPPLRARIEDIPMLTKHFLKEYNKKYNKNKTIDLSAVEVMQSYDWPGNVRELENLIERLVVVENDEKIVRQQVTKMITNNPNVVLFDKGSTTLEEAQKLLERQLIQNALHQFGSTYKAADALGVSQATISRKAKTLGIKLKSS